MLEQATFDLVVVGAGLTGLTAALECRRRGLSVLVLEGRDRLGGRTYTKREIRQGKTSFYDFGAHFIGHDAPQDNIRKLVKDLGLKTFPQYEGPDDPSLPLSGQAANLLTHWNGGDPERIRTQAYVGQIYPDSWSGLLRMGELEALLFEMEEVGIGWFLDKGGFDGVSVAGWVDSLSTRRDQNLYDLLNLLCRVGFSADATEISMLWFLFYIASNGGLDAFSNVRYRSQGAQGYRLNQGTMAIAEALAACFVAAGGTILTGKAVDAIDLGDTPGWVRCRDGSRFSAQRVLVATSPRLANAIAVSPRLPEARLQAAAAMRNGQTVMTVMHFDRYFWRDDTTRYTHGTFNGWSQSDISVNGLSGNALLIDGPVVWTMDNTSAEDVPAMFAFVVAKEAEAWADKSESTRRKIVANCLGALYGRDNVERHFTGYEDYLWTTDPFAMGCPTGHFGPGQFDLWRHVLLLPDMPGSYLGGRLFFASTESAMVSNGYMSGAVWSGGEIATRILRTAPA